MRTVGLELGAWIPACGQAATNAACRGTACLAGHHYGVREGPRRGGRTITGITPLRCPGCAFCGALARQRGLHTRFLTRFQIESVPFAFLDDVLLQNLTLEALPRVFQRFTVLSANFGQHYPQ